MHRSVTTAWCLAVVVSVVVAPTMANEETTPAADATSLPPEREGPVADAPTSTLAVAESEELDRLGARFEREIRQLEALAREVKGLELVGLQRRIESLKLEQRAEELRIRAEAARKAGDDARVQALEGVTVDSVAPQPVRPAVVEPRPDPDDDGTGGAS